MFAYYVTIAVVCGVIYGGYQWVQAAKRYEAADPALAKYTMGAKPRTAAIGAAYDQTKTTEHQRRLDASAARRRAKSAKAVKAAKAKPEKVTPMRKRA